VSYSHNGLNQLTEAGSNPFGYDSLGNLDTGLNGWTYGYDHESRLRSATTAADTVNLKYDPLVRSARHAASVDP